MSVSINALLLGAKLASMLNLPLTDNQMLANTASASSIYTPQPDNLGHWSHRPILAVLKNVRRGSQD